jgi:hypothetical protein
MKEFKQHLFESQIKSRNPVNVDAYHGGGRKFDKFSQVHAKIPNDFYGGGVGYFTDSKPIAETYARSSAKTTGTPHLYHTTLAMSNVFDVDHVFTGNKLTSLLPKDTRKFAQHAGLLHAGNMDNENSILGDLERGNTSLSGHQLFWGLSEGGTKTAKARDHLIKNGFDGLRYNGGVNMRQETNHNVYIPYNADSIKINKVARLK